MKISVNPALTRSPPPTFTVPSNCPTTTTLPSLPTVMASPEHEPVLRLEWSQRSVEVAAAACGGSIRHATAVSTMHRMDKVSDENLEKREVAVEKPIYPPARPVRGNKKDSVN